MRQLFVGVTGEREVAAAMERVIAELKAAGADDRGRPDSVPRRAVQGGARQRTWLAQGRLGGVPLAAAPGPETRCSRSTI